MSYQRLSKPHPHNESPGIVTYKVKRTDIEVLADREDHEYPIAIVNADWWLTKTQVADLITTLTKALQETP